MSGGRDIERTNVASVGLGAPMSARIVRVVGCVPGAGGALSAEGCQEGHAYSCRSNRIVLVAASRARLARVEHISRAH